MATNKSLVLNTSAIFRYRNFGYETQNELRLQNQALILAFSQKL